MDESTYKRAAVVNNDDCSIIHFDRADLEALRKTEVPFDDSTSSVALTEIK